MSQCTIHSACPAPPASAASAAYTSSCSASHTGHSNYVALPLSTCATFTTYSSSTTCGVESSPPSAPAQVPFAAGNSDWPHMAARTLCGAGPRCTTSRQVRQVRSPKNL
eukprot:scaffold29647_cov145-Isochrysis_galbana.AAC.8